MGILFQKPGRPIRTNPISATQDVQGAIPRSWCVKCGTEIFKIGRIFCPRCHKEETSYDAKRKSL